MRHVPLLVPFLLLGACATVPRAPGAPIEVQILGLNDFHGNLQPSGPVTLLVRMVKKSRRRGRVGWRGWRPC